MTFPHYDRLNTKLTANGEASKKSSEAGRADTINLEELHRAMKEARVTTEPNARLTKRQATLVIFPGPSP